MTPIPTPKTDGYAGYLETPNGIEELVSADVCRGIETELSTALQTVSDLEKQQAETQIAFEAMVDIDKATVKERDALKMSVADLEKRAKVLEDDIIKSQNIFQSANADSSKFKRERDDLEKKVGELENKHGEAFKELAIKLKDKCNEIVGLRDNLATTKAALVKANNMAQALSDDLTIVGQDREELRSQLSDKQREVETLQKRYNHLEKGYDLIDDALSELAAGTSPSDVLTTYLPRLIQPIRSKKTPQPTHHMNNTETPESRLVNWNLRDIYPFTHKDILSVLDKLSTLQSQHVEDLAQIAALRSGLTALLIVLDMIPACKDLATVARGKELIESTTFKPVIKLEDLEGAIKQLEELDLCMAAHTQGPVLLLRSALAVLNGATNPKEKE